jgi:hypothetical protein
MVIGALLHAGSRADAATGVVVAAWSMDEKAGSVMYDRVDDHDGRLHSVQLGQPGFKGTAYGFTGSSYVSVPSAGSLNPGSAKVTVTIHLNTTRVPTNDWDVIRKGYFDSPGGEFKVEYQSSGQASCGFKGSKGYRELIAGPALDDGRWHTVRCVKTTSAIQLIVDGQRFSAAANIGSISNTEPIVIGSRPGTQYFIGRLDQASIRFG